MTAKLTITRGLPASGKSTWAEEQRKADPDHVRVVTLDDIRAALGTRYEQGDEPIAQSVRDFTIKRFLERGYHVISADTNLNPRVVGQITRLAAHAAEQRDEEFLSYPVEVQDFTDVPLETCLARNTLRHTMGDFKVPHEAIIEMHRKFIANA